MVSSGGATRCDRWRQPSRCLMAESLYADVAGVAALMGDALARQNGRLCPIRWRWPHSARSMSTATASGDTDITGVLGGDAVHLRGVRWISQPLWASRSGQGRRFPCGYPSPRGSRQPARCVVVADRRLAGRRVGGQWFLRVVKVRCLCDDQN